MIYVWFTGGALVAGGLIAFAAVKAREKFRAAISAIHERERAMAERLAKAEAALSEKAAATELRHVSAMLEGVATVCRRMEDRLSELDRPAGNARSKPAGD